MYFWQYPEWSDYWVLFNKKRSIGNIWRCLLRVTTEIRRHRHDVSSLFIGPWREEIDPGGCEVKAADGRWNPSIKSPGSSLRYKVVRCTIIVLQDRMTEMQRHLKDSPQVLIGWRNTSRKIIDQWIMSGLWMKGVLTKRKWCRLERGTCRDSQLQDKWEGKDLYTELLSNLSFNKK